MCGEDQLRKILPNALLSYVFMTNFVKSRQKSGKKSGFKLNKLPQHFSGYPKINSQEKISQIFSLVCFYDQFCQKEAKIREKTGFKQKF